MHLLYLLHSPFLYSFTILVSDIFLTLQKFSGFLKLGLMVSFKGLIDSLVYVLRVKMWIGIPVFSFLPNPCASNLYFLLLKYFQLSYIYASAVLNSNTVNFRKSSHLLHYHLPKIHFFCRKPLSKPLSWRPLTLTLSRTLLIPSLSTSPSLSTLIFRPRPSLLQLSSPSPPLIPATSLLTLAPSPSLPFLTQSLFPRSPSPFLHPSPTQ